MGSLSHNSASWNHLLGGSGVVLSRVISPLIRVISIVTVTLLIIRLITTHEPPSMLGPEPRIPVPNEGPRNAEDVFRPYGPWLCRSLYMAFC